MNFYLYYLIKMQNKLTEINKSLDAMNGNGKRKSQLTTKMN